MQTLKVGLKHKAKTIHNILSVLGRLTKIAVEWGVIDRLPCAIKLLKVTTPVMRFYEPEQYAQLVEAASKVDPRAAIAILLGGGCRVTAGRKSSL